MDPPRKESGYRQYSYDVINRIRFIRRTQELGFSLREIGDLLTLCDDPATGWPEVRARLEAKIRDVSLKIANLEQMKHGLTQIIEKCEAQTSFSLCHCLNR